MSAAADALSGYSDLGTPSSFGVLRSDATGVATSTSSIASDPTVDYLSTSDTVVPNYLLSTVDLPGQLPSIPGGASANGAYPGGAADPSGVNSLYLHPAVNPTPTGGYMNVLASVANAAATGFSTFVKGSPSVATPPPRLPGGSISAPMLAGKTNWLLIGGVVIAGLAAIAFLAAKA